MLNVLSLFSGIGAFETALANLNIKTDIKHYCEIDPYAAEAYAVLHNVSQAKNLGDITKVSGKFNYDIDLLTYGFPCQDLSIAGKKKGLGSDDEKTRSGLVWDALRIIDTCRPKFCICENVKNLVGTKFIDSFNIILDKLDSIGYVNYYKVLNAKDFNCPQSRERIFIISIRKDIDRGFTFPEPVELTKRLYSVLETDVNAKYFLTNEQVAKIRLSNYNQERTRIQDKDVTRTLLARDSRGPICVDTAKIKQLGGHHKFRSSFCVYDKDYIAPTLTTCQGGGIHAHIIDLSKIRRLTPREYLRLMGFNDLQINSIVPRFSDSRLYKMAGNSIVVNVLEAIFKQLQDNYSEYF